MRIFIALLLLACAAPARAQEQESRLLDRLLRPDMSMQNTAQNKQFTTGGSRARTDKQAVVTSFQGQKKSSAKQFYGTREVDGSNYATHHFRDGDGTASISRNARLTKTANVAANSTNVTSAAVASGRAVTTSDFASSRPFLDQGKSQKALSQQNKPLTIEQVRELLNKNK